MARGGPRGGQRTVYRDPGVSRSVARAGRRLGTALLGAGLPALFATGGAATLVGDAAGGPFDWMDAAVATPLLGGEGLLWAFHVALLVSVLGVVSLAGAFVVEGLLGG